MKNQLKLNREAIENFGNEIESIYKEAKEKVGREDLDHILEMKAISNSLEIAGRSLIYLSKDPLTWVGGILLLGYHYLLEFTELGHNILHGQYDDIPGNTKVLSKNWKWDSTMDEEDWKFEHHVVHHPFTNIIGKDNDFGFLLYRVNDSQPWKPHHIFQVPMLLSMPLVNTFFFPWYVSTSRALAESREILTWETYVPSLKKIGTHLFKNYFLFPLMPGANYFKIATGNFLAKLFQNFYLEMILAISHLHKDAYIFENIENESKGDFYLRQVLSTVNFDSPYPYSIVYGAINLHIEHHLFPDLPPNRLREVAPKIKSVCEKYGIPYRSGSFLSQFLGVIENALLRSLPLKPEDDENVWNLIFNPQELLQRVLGSGKNISNLFSQDDHQLFSKAKIIDSRIEIDGDAKSLVIEVPKDWKTISWREGAFISVELFIDGKKYIRQYSLTYPSLLNRHLHITVKRMKDGKVSNFINDYLNKGDSITIIGKPKGKFTLSDTGSKILLLSAGSGITPIISMIRKLEFEGKLTNCKLIYFNKSPQKAIFFEELLEFQEKGLDCSFYFDIPSPGFKQESVTKILIEREVPDILTREIYLCAPPGFINTATKILGEIGIEKNNLYLESFIPPALSADPSRADNFHLIKLVKSQKEIRINENTNLLNAIESVNIPVTSGCRQGLCKSCQVIKLKGKINTETHSIDIPKRITLCNSFPRSNIELDI